MLSFRGAAQEAAEDVFFGQVVVIWARWFIIAAGAVLVLWTATGATQLSVAILPVLILMGMNFYIHGRYFVERPVSQPVLILTALVDVAVITLMVLFWSEQKGLDSPFFVLYYPLLLAFAFVMPRPMTVAFTSIVLAAYLGVVVTVDVLSASSMGDLFFNDPTELKRLVLRVITLSSVGALGSYYWRMQRESMRRAIGGSGDHASGGTASEAVVAAGGR